MITSMKLLSQTVLVTRGKLEEVKQFIAHLSKSGLSGRVQIEQDEAEICKKSLGPEFSAPFKLV